MARLHYFSLKGCTYYLPIILLLVMSVNPQGIFFKRPQARTSISQLDQNPTQSEKTETSTTAVSIHRYNTPTESKQSQVFERSPFANKGKMFNLIKTCIFRIRSNYVVKFISKPQRWVSVIEILHLIPTVNFPLHRDS